MLLQFERPFRPEPNLKCVFTDMDIILSLLGTLSLDPSPTDKHDPKNDLNQPKDKGGVNKTLVNFRFMNFLVPLSLE